MTAPRKAQVVAAAILMTFSAGLMPMSALAAGGRHPGPGDLPPQHNEVRNGARELSYGRAVILRTGEMPRLSPTEGADNPTRRVVRTRRAHNLETTLPVIIQGAPQHWVLRRFASTG